MAYTAESILRRPLYVYDLPPEILDTIQLKLESNIPTAEHSIPEASPETSTPSTPANGVSQKTISCALCAQTFPTVHDQRGHVKSDLHNYNLKQRLRNATPVTEHEFEKLVANLDESLSGSATESSEDEEEAKKDGAMLSALLKKQANIDDDDEFVARKRKRGPGNAPLIWFNTPTLPSNSTLGVYRALFTANELEQDPVQILRAKQLSPISPTKRKDDDGGVPLPAAKVGPHIFLCMIGGGHFAGMVVSLAPKLTKKGGVEERQATVLAHKTFHRYTTRRKQGGAQSSNDASKGNAHSAGASIRRYNEDALMKEVREVLAEWKDLISTSDLLFVRATSNTNRNTLFGPYDGQVLRRDDPRLRGFPFNTRRPTQAELMRCFVELTRAKVNEVDEAAEAEARQRAAAEEEAKLLAANLKKEAKEKQKVAKDPEADVALLHTTQLEALIRRSKAPALVSYISSNSLSPDFRFHPADSQQHHHTPTPLHMASSMNLPALVTTLLVKAGADPGSLNGEGKTPFDVAGDRATRDAFRLARFELGEDRWDWSAAQVPEALSRAQVEQRTQQEKREEAAKESSRRAADLDRIQEEEAQRAAEQELNTNARRDKKMGKGHLLGEKQMTAEERREEQARGMTPEMRMRLERERRARAAERRMQQG